MSIRRSAPGEDTGDDVDAFHALKRDALPRPRRDLVMGRGPSALATLVERRTHYLRLVALPKGAKAVPVRRALVEDLNQVPFWQRRSLPSDRGREMADLVRFTRETGCRVYFCDLSGPWQRGTNENTNRLGRRYLPKSGDLGSFDQAALDAIA